MPYLADILGTPLVKPFVITVLTVLIGLIVLAYNPDLKDTHVKTGKSTTTSYVMGFHPLHLVVVMLGVFAVIVLTISDVKKLLKKNGPVTLGSN